MSNGIFKLYYNGDVYDAELPAALTNQFTQDTSPLFLTSAQIPPGLEIAGTGNLEIFTNGHTYGPYVIANDYGTANTYVFLTPLPLTSDATWNVYGGDGTIGEIYFKASTSMSGFPLELVADADHTGAGVDGGLLTILDWDGTAVALTATLTAYEQTGDVTAPVSLPSGEDFTVGAATLTTAQPQGTFTYSGPVVLSDQGTGSGVFLVLALPNSGSGSNGENGGTGTGSQPDPNLPMASTYITSRRSKVLHVHYPTQPASPLVVNTIPVNNGVATAVVQFNFNGDMRNIYGFELRTADNYTVIYQRPVASYADLYVDLAANTPLPYIIAPGTFITLIAYFFNQAWAYSAPTWVDVVVPSVNTSASVVSDSATFGLGTGGTTVVPSNDACPHFICLTQGGTLVTATASCATWGADVVTPLFIHLAISSDSGATWTDIFTQKPSLVIPGGSAAVSSATPDDGTKINKNDQMKVIVFSGSNTTCQNVSVSVGWSSV